MTKDLKAIDLNSLPIETLKEMANEAGEQVENNAKLTVQKAIDCGRYLTAIKEQCEPGKWLAWLGVNWNYSQPTASRYMAIADSYSRVNNLKDAKSIREAMRMIADDKDEKTVPRSERKPADVVVSIPSDHIVDTNEMVDKVVDDDPTPDPPTNRKTAKGSEKVSEDKKPRTASITPEILPDEPESLPEEKTLADFCEHEILEYLVATADDAKRRAKALRKAADKLDPPTKFVKPDGNDVLAFLTGYVTTDKFISKYGALTPDDVETAADGFIDHYSSNGWMVGKVKMQDWRATARKWVSNQGQFGKVNGNGAANRGSTKPAKPTGASVFG